MQRTLRGWQAGLIALMAAAWILYGLMVLKAPTSIVLTVAAALTAVGAGCFGISWTRIEGGIYQAVRSVVPAILILFIVGMLVGVWMLSGTVPTMVHYGLSFLPPGLFLVAATALACIVSLATGTSWGTLSTVGIALMGIGGGLGIPLPAVAGAIVVGGFFGDKLSPLSDTTNLAAAVTDTDLFKHIKHMLLTTIPALVVSLLVFAWMGASYAGNTANLSDISLMQMTLQSQFAITPLLLLPPVLVIALIIMKKPVLPSLFAGVAAGGLLAVATQGASLAAVLGAMNKGYASTTGVALVDSLLNRGGLSSMLGTSALVIAASAFGGVMRGAGMLEALVAFLGRRVTHPGQLVLSTVVANLGIVLLTGSCYVSMSVLGPVFAPLYRHLGLRSENLSRTLEDTGTVVVPLVPWSITGLFVAETLGVPVLAYFPYAIMCYMSGVFALIYGFTGFGLSRMTKEEKAAVPVVPVAAD